MAFGWPTAALTRSKAETVPTIAALEPRLTVDEGHGESWVTWFEGGRERVFEVARVLVDEEDRFVFDDVAGNRFTLSELTLDRYERFVRPFTMGKPSFQTQDEMIAAMRMEW